MIKDKCILNMPAICACWNDAFFPLKKYLLSFDASVRFLWGMNKES
jgi:hypothetical protein